MSIFIKGIEMPQAGDVIVCGQVDGKLQATIVTRGKQTKWCEISEIPTPHGDLIDRSLLLNEWKVHPEEEKAMMKENLRAYLLMDEIANKATENIGCMSAIIKAED